jgi:hypothetical protein
MKKITPLRAIKLKCIDCCCGSKNEVKKCEIIECALYRYRFGRLSSVSGSYKGKVKGKESKNSGI